MNRGSGVPPEDKGYFHIGDSQVNRGSGVPPDNKGYFHNDAEVLKRRGYFLPHWRQESAIYHTVFRLRDSLPQNAIDELRAQSASQEILSQRVEDYLDAGIGSCLFNDHALADVLADAMTYFEGKRYSLHAWCVMPNHAHAVVEPFPGYELSCILHSWKSFSAHRINSITGRRSEVWQKESFDHIIRSETEYLKTIAYVLQNPLVAGLVNWKWIGGKSFGEDAETTMGRHG